MARDSLNAKETTLSGRPLMPLSVNGFGTEYYFRRQQRHRLGTCPNCGPVTLADYQVGHFLIVFYLPLLPLGRRIILSECSHCGHHQNYPLRRWLVQKEASIERDLQALQQSPRDPARAFRMLNTYTDYLEFEDAQSLANAIEVTYATDYESLLQLANWYEKRLRLTDAKRLQTIAVEMAPNRIESIRIRLQRAIEEGAIESITRYSEVLLAERSHSELDVVFQAAQALFEFGDFEQAFSLFHQMLKTKPELEKDPAFRRAARKIEQALGRPASLVRPKLWGFWD